MTFYELGLYIAACILEVIFSWLEFQRTGLTSRLFGCFGFLCLAVGIAAFASGFGWLDYVDRHDLMVFARAVLACGAVCWIIDRFAWMRSRVRVVGSDQELHELHDKHPPVLRRDS